VSQTYATPAGTDPANLVLKDTLPARDEALRSLFSGSSAPTSPTAYQLWADTANKILKQRNAANNAWVDLLPLGDTVRLSQPLQLSGSLAAATLQQAMAMAGKLLKVLLVPNATTLTSVATTKEYTFMLRNVTQAVDAFSATPSTATSVGGVGGGEMTANAAYALTPNQNQQFAASDVIRFTVAVNGSPTSVSNCSIVLVYELVGV
jgi:hypothetical protein